MPGVNFSWYIANEDYALYLKFKETIAFKAREAADKELQRLKGFTFKKSSEPVNTSVLEEVSDDKVHKDNAKNKASVQSDRAIKAKVRKNESRAS